MLNNFLSFMSFGLGTGEGGGGDGDPPLLATAPVELLYDADDSTVSVDLDTLALASGGVPPYSYTDLSSVDLVFSFDGDHTVLINLTQPEQQDEPLTCIVHDSVGQTVAGVMLVTIDIFLDVFAGVEEASFTVSDNGSPINIRLDDEQFPVDRGPLTTLPQNLDPPTFSGPTAFIVTFDYMGLWTWDLALGDLVMTYEVMTNDGEDTVLDSGAWTETADFDIEDHVETGVKFVLTGTIDTGSASVELEVLVATPLWNIEEGNEEIIVVSSPPATPITIVSVGDGTVTVSAG